jgi:hypothetical protein
MSETLASRAPAALTHRAPPPRRTAHGAVYVAIALAVALAWFVVRATGLQPATRAGYWLGVAGGTMMLGLFAYPLRKRLRFMARWGAAKWWFAVHMVLGIAGPLLVLVHSTFRAGSLNAAVALYSMLIVAASGVVGRFLYLQLHRGLSGERETLAHLQRALGLDQDNVHSALAGSASRKVERLLHEFEQAALAGPAGAMRHFAAFTALPLRRRWAAKRCAQLLRDDVRARAKVRRWDARTAAAEYRTERDAVEACLRGIERVAQFHAATRLFSLWHVLHVPIVYVMVLCAIVHVVAVHAY